MIKIAYLILAHKSPSLLKRLVKKLTCEHVSFYIHIDKGVNINPFRSALSELKDSKIFYIDRVKSQWGRIGLVHAVLNGFKIISEASPAIDYVFILSGQDYPLKSNNEIASFFEKNYGKNFISHFACSTNTNQEEWKIKIMTERIAKYHIYIFGKHYIYPSQPKNLTDKYMQMLMSLFFKKQRKHPPHLKPFADSQWFCITSEAVSYILDFIRQYPEFIRFHKYTFAPDEMFFQTILLNSKNSKITESIVNDNLKFIDWTKPEIFHPMVFSKDDFDTLMNSNKLFARKFDLNVCSDVLDLIDSKTK